MYLVAVYIRNPSSWRKYRHWPPTYLEVYVSDPFHDSVTCPNNGVPVLVLTVSPPNLQSLQKHNAEITVQGRTVCSTEKSHGRKRACCDNAAAKTCGQLQCIITHITCCFAKYSELYPEQLSIKDFSPDSLYVLTSLSKLTIWSSWIARSRLVWWPGSLMLRNRSRSRRFREFSTRPSTKWVWKVWEYCGKPTSLSHDVATQWWSISDALDSLEDDRTHQIRSSRGTLIIYLYLQ